MKLNLKNILLLGVVSWFAGVALLGLLFLSVSKDLPSYEQLENYNPRLVTRIISSDGEVLKEFYTQRRVYVPLESVPEHLLNAALATEDRRFYNHWGVDAIRLTKALLVDISTMSKKQGASTITQQLAKNLFFSYERTYTRKFREMMVALQIESRFEKAEILEAYLNQIPFGVGAFGVEQAAPGLTENSESDQQQGRAVDQRGKYLGAMPAVGTRIAGRVSGQMNRR